VAPPARTRAGSGLPPASDQAALNWLLRRSVRRYRASVRGALVDAGFGDIPQAGIWAISALAVPGSSARDLVERMEISKQAVAELVDTLVGQGYVERLPYPSDRRRTLLQLTASGSKALRVIDRAVRGVEQQMAERIGLERLGDLYVLLAELDRS
jgi:DNA-binding MarR family transcriptional regulator